MAKALVTGASGFIGSTLIAELAKCGIEPLALMRRTSSDANLKGLSFSRIEGDLRDQTSLERAVAGVDYVFHLAGAVTARDREEFFEHNVRGVERLVDAAARVNPGLKRFVHVSSLAAGGPSIDAQPQMESATPRPVSIYGESKLAGEQAVLAVSSRVPVTIIRPPLVYGPRDKAVLTVIKPVARGLVVKIGSAQKYYSHVHVEDLTAGIIQAALASLERSPSGEVYYLCADAMVTFDEMMSAIAAAAGKRPMQIRVPMGAIRVAARALTVVGRALDRTFPLNNDKVHEIAADYWICSNAKARERLGFQPRYGIQEGMQHTISWYRREGWL